MAINKIMVLGAGTMGMGIAQVFAEAGKTVIVRDIADAFIQRGEGVLKKNLEKKVSKGKITEDQKNEMLSRVSFTLELADAKDCDLVVEAAIEVLDVKKDIFKELDTICKPEDLSWPPTPPPSPSPPLLLPPSVLRRSWACTSSTPLPL